MLGSGTLITPTVVVTAAHVLYENVDTNRRQPFELVVVAGALDAQAPASGQQVSVAKAVPHENFTISSPLDKNGLSQENDIGVIVLQQPITSLAVVPTLPYAKFGSDLTKGTPMTIEGYGINDVDSGAKSVLFTAQTPYQLNNGSEFLVGGSGKPDTCNDDSGGPAYVTIGGTMYVAGIVSRAAVLDLNGGLTCGQGGVYTILDNYDGWIAANSGDASSPVSALAGCSCKVEQSPTTSALGLSLAFGVAVLAARRRRSS